MAAIAGVYIAIDIGASENNSAQTTVVLLGDI
jgi:hypothetical protein